jgi:bacillithiol biosynthesis deacetylase BshB1
MSIDVMAFSPHPDDAEMGCGGLLLKLKDKGYSTGIVDLTESELSTNGDIETRKKETEIASRLLMLDLRENLNLSDCNITNDYNSRLKVVEIVRKYRPKMTIIPFYKDRHPDHENAHKLLKDAIFVSGLEKLKTVFPFHRPKIVICYMLNYNFEPSFIVNISNYHKQKMKACKAYRSQFYREDITDRSTYINSRFFRDMITSRDKFYGLRIKTEHGEPFFIESDIKIEDPVEFFGYLF